MACMAMHMWSLSGLVAAFLDLAIAYLFLSASAVAFITSKFLGFFGLNLPCPCDGLFFNTPFKEYCLNRLLVDFPTQKVSNVHASVKNKFPFDDSVWGRSRTTGCVNRITQMEDEASCSSVSDVRTVGEDLSVEKYDMKGKEVIDHRPRSRLRHRRKGWRGRGVYSSVSSFDASLNDESAAWKPRRSTNSISIRAIRTPLESGFSSPHRSTNKGPTVMGVKYTNIQQNQYPDEISAGESQDNPQEVEILSGDEDTIRHLEQELQRERTARAALYSELEKERSAAASAADEAMAMILRLQEEKASIEMDARQYQRIIEEKSVYDAEEMDILKEILVRREREKLVLEKEVETYRQMVSNVNEQPAVKGSEDARKMLGLMLDPNEDPLVMLHRLTKSTDSKAVGNESSNQYQDEKSSLQDQGDFDEQQIEFPISDTTKHQEKEMFLYEDNDSYFTPKAPDESECMGNTFALQGENLAQTEEVNLGPERSKNITSGVKQQANNEHMQDFQFYDVHVDEPLCLSNEASPSKTADIPSSIREAKDSSERSVTKTDDVTTKSRWDTEVGVKKGISDITSGLPPVGPKGKTVLPNLRRSSMSAVDSEMLKIDWEVSKLRERLRVVREGREKLSSCVESREGENIQLKLLEDIARQVQEIRHLTQPGISERQISLPLPTSKGLSKKRRCKSVSSGFQRSFQG